VTASIRVSVPSLLLATHTEPSPTAMPLGPLPTGIVSTTLFTVGLIQDTVPLHVFATHTEPAPTAIALGVETAGIVSLTACVAGSIRDTVPAL